MTVAACPWELETLVQVPGVGLYQGPFGVAVLQLENSPKKNALSAEVVRGLAQALATLGAKPAPRAVVLVAEGAVFCSGADLNEVLETPSPVDFVGQLAVVMLALASLPCPLIALAQGAAVGGGVGLLACADVVLVEKAIRFALAEVRLGLVPAVISPFLFRKGHPSQWAPFVFSGQPFFAPQAQNLGLVHGTWEGGAAPQVWQGALAPYLQAAPLAVQRAKKLMLAQHPLPSPRLLEAMAQEFGAACQSPEGQQGLASFQNKDKPPWFVEWV